MVSGVQNIQNSEYARFGSYLNQKHFIATLFVAFLLHGLGVAIYYLTPTEVVEEIPVRVLNVKLGGDVSAAAITSADVKRLFAKRRLAKDPSAPKVSTPESRAEAVEQVIARRQAEPEPEASPAEPVPSPTPKVEKKAKPEPARSALEAPQKKPEPPKKTEAPKPKIAKKPLSKPKPPAKPKAKKEPKLKRYVRSNKLTAKVKPKPGKAKSSEGSAIGNSETADKQSRIRYTQTVSLWIDKHKVYPTAARAKGEGGKVILRIRINRQGRILRYLLEKSSGSEAIDRAITQMIDAANPLPPVPSDYPDKKSYLEFLIPINFIP
jgi:protein TonB